MTEKKTTLPEAAAVDGKETKIDVVAGNAKALVEQTTEDAAQEEENRAFETAGAVHFRGRVLHQAGLDRRGEPDPPPT